MRLFPSLLLSTLVVLAFGAATRPSDARACAMAFAAERTSPRVEGEEALIVWDEAHHIEHFVRSARFAGVTESFAFLVPTPGRPELAESTDAVFGRLMQHYLRPPPALRSRARSAGGHGADSMPSSESVTVVEQRRVSGLDATVLAATDASALATWLRSHGYASRPTLEAWLAPYVERGYHVTAFRYDPASQTSVTSSAVRLSFATDRPFYPYAEPSDGSRSASRRLRISVVAPWRAEGRVGERRWSARTGFADRLPLQLPSILAGVVPAPETHGPWITTFEEQPSRRGRDDLFFQAARAQSAVRASITGTIIEPHASGGTTSTALRDLGL